MNIEEVIKLLNDVITDIHTHSEFQTAKKKLMLAVRLLADDREVTKSHDSSD